jgi:hypothetical protein
MHQLDAEAGIPHFEKKKPISEITKIGSSDSFKHERNMNNSTKVQVLQLEGCE